MISKVTLPIDRNKSSLELRLNDRILLEEFKSILDWDQSMRVEEIPQDYLYLFHKGYISKLNYEPWPLAMISKDGEKLLSHKGYSLLSYFFK